MDRFGDLLGYFFDFIIVVVWIALLPVWILVYLIALPAVALFAWISWYDAEKPTISKPLYVLKIALVNFSLWYWFRVTTMIVINTLTCEIFIYPYDIFKYQIGPLSKKV